MKEIICIGSDVFTLGFKMAGIRKTIEVKNEVELVDKINMLKQDNNIGIVIVDEQILDKVESNQRSSIEDSVLPVFVALSVNTTQDNIRRLIIKSIGVDILKGEE